MQKKRPNPVLFFVSLGIVILTTSYVSSRFRSLSPTEEVLKLRDEVSVLRESIGLMQKAMDRDSTDREATQPFDVPVAASNPSAVHALLDPYTESEPRSEARQARASQIKARLFERSAAQILSWLGRPDDFFARNGVAVWSYAILEDNRSVEIGFVDGRVSAVQIY